MCSPLGCLALGTLNCKLCLMKTAEMRMAIVRILQKNFTTELNKKYNLPRENAKSIKFCLLLFIFIVVIAVLPKNSIQKECF